MPKLPVILATEGITAPQGPRIPLSAGTTGYEGIAAAGRAASGAFLDFADARARADHQEAALLASDAEMRLSIGDGQLRKSTSNPDQYQADHEKLIAQTIKDVSATATRPEAAALMQRHLLPVLNKTRVSASQYAQTLKTDQAVANLDATLETRKALAAAALSDTEFQRQYEEGANAITLATKDVGGANKAGDMLRAYRKDLLEARALKESHEQPEQFVLNADARFGLGAILGGKGALDAKIVEQLKESARKKDEENKKEVQRLQERAEAKYDKEAERQRQQSLTGLSLAASNRQLTAQQVIDARDRGEIQGPTEFEHFMTLTTKQNTAESDPQVWNAVQSDVWSSQPTISEARIRGLMARHADGGAGLNGEHGRMALMELGRKREHDISEGRVVENQQHSRKKEAYTLAKEEALRALGITTPMSQLDKTEAKLVSEFERQYNARVLDADGNVRTDVPPRDVMLTILPVFQARQSSDARLKYEEQAAIVSGLVGSQVPDVMDPKFIEWYAQQQKATEALGADPKTLGLYKLRREQLLRLARTRNERLQIEARKNVLSTGGGKATGGYKPPGE